MGVILSSRSRQRRRKQRVRILSVASGIAAAAILAIGVGVVATQGQEAEAVSESVASAYAANSTLAPAAPARPKLPIVSFIGDSYTQGTGASSKESRWSTLVSQQLGWDELNVGRGGTGYVTTAGRSACGLATCLSYPDMVTSATGQNVTAVVISGGYNDFKAFSTDPASVVAGIDKTFNDVRAAMPDVKIIALGPTVPGNVTPTVEAFDKAVQAAAARVGAQYISLIAPDVSSKEMLTDGVHVNDAGHKAIADRVIAALSKG